MATQQERRTATRKQILDAASTLFVAQGYDGTSTDMILDRAGVSRGALYHHFAAKEDVFAAVFDAASQAAMALMRAHIDPKDSPLEQLISGSVGWLQAVRRPDLAAILLDQGPQALGWVRARDLESRSSLGVMRASIQAAVAAGQISVPSVEAAARILNAAIAEAALAWLHNKRSISAKDAEETIRCLILGLSVRA